MLVSLVAVVLVLVVGFVVLAMSDKDTSAYTLFLAGPLVSTIIGGLVARKVDQVEAVATRVEKQTNGLLSERLDKLHEHLDEQTAELQSSPETPPAAGSPLPSPRPPGPRLPGSPAEHRPPGTGTDQPVSR